MTKEEILQYHLPEKIMEELEDHRFTFYEYPNIVVDILDEIYDAMEEYSKEQSVSFIEWATLNYYYSTMNVNGTWIHKTTGVYQTPNELYKLFIKNK